MPLAPGVRLGVYEVTALIGAGGMGEVYRARDTKLGRDVALKVLPEAFARDPERIARFEREARTLAALNHPNIAIVHGFEEADPSTSAGAAIKALVMELVEGPTLEERLRAHDSGPRPTGALPVSEAMDIARQIAEALEAAHEHGIIHRDLKPANVKVRDDGTVKVLDFGLAKLTQAEGSGPGGQADFTQSPTITTPAHLRQGYGGQAVTQMGVILGTAAYMSPEQARGKAVDRRTDVWAFGCVLYEMLTGRQTFEAGETVSDAVAAILKNDADWRALPADTPAYVRALLRRCLQKDPRRRLPHIGVARLEIEEGADQEGAAAPSGGPALPLQPRPRWRRALPILITTIVVGVLAGATAWNLKPSPQLAISRSRFTLPAGQLFSNIARQMIGISPDGTQAVYVANQRLYLRSLSELEARPIPGTETLGGQGLALPVFSPDGRSIAFLRFQLGPSTIHRVDVSGGPVTTVSQVDRVVLPNGMSWSTSGIVFDQGSLIMRVPASGGTPERLASAESEEVAQDPQMLPGNRAVLFAVAASTGANRWDKARIVVHALGSGERKTLVEGGSSARYVPSGHIVYAAGRTLLAVPFDADRLEVTGRAVPVVEGVRQSVGTGSAQFGISDTGVLVFIPGALTAGDLRDLVLIDPKGGVERLRLPSAEYESPRISPDGRQVTFGTDDGNEAIVWIYELSGASAPRRLTFGGRNRFPVWSTDGQRIAFQSDRDGDPGIYWQRADGADTAERLTTPDRGTSHMPESWTPKGDRLSFSVIAGSSASLWTFSLQGKKVAPLGDVRSMLPLNSAFSPDGRWVAYTLRGGEMVNVFVEPFPPTGAKYQVSKDNGSRRPIWSPDGRALFYLTPESLAVVSVRTQPSFAVGNPEPLSVRGGPSNQSGPTNHDITRDGKRFIVAVPASGPEGGTRSEIEIVHNWFEELKRRVPTR